MLTIPLNLLLIWWIAVGRALFGTVTAWAGYVLLFVAGPVMLACLTLSTVLAFCARARPTRLSTAQAWLQVVCWVGMFVVGIAVVDGDDAGHVGGMLYVGSGLIAAAAWVGLVVLSIVAPAEPRRPVCPGYGYLPLA